MRDLEMEELGHVYGAGGCGKSPCAPKKQPKCGKGGSSRRKCKGGTTRRRCR